MTREKKIKWLTIMREAEAKEGFETLFDEDEEVSVSELLSEIIEDYKQLDECVVIHRNAFE